MKTNSEEKKTKANYELASLANYELASLALQRREMTESNVGMTLAKARANMERALRDAEASLAASSPYDQSAWAILYGSMVNGYGVDPLQFQLVYPLIPWDWATENLGYIGPAQYDTLSTIPAWSAVGKYSSAGDRFNNQYKAFLNVISPDTSDPALRRRIDEAFNDLTDKTNAYTRTVQQARDAYNSAPSNNKPDFTPWLGTIDGKGWQTKISSTETAMNQSQKNYTAVVDEASTPNLTEALDASRNQDYYAKLNDPNLAAMPKVPNWSTTITAQKWADKAANGDVPSGGINISNSDSAYSYSNSWAGGSAEVGNWFWSVKVSGSWERIDEFASDQSLSAAINFQGIEEIGIQPSPWFMGVTNLQNGPYKRGFSKDGGDNTVAVFGEKGFLPMIKTGMYVVYKPSFSIDVKKSTFTSFKEKFNASTDLRIGPFTFSAEGGHERAGWEANEAGLSFSGKSTSTVPAVIGFTIKLLP
jgi:hypothetical protein